MDTILLIINIGLILLVWSDLRGEGRTFISKSKNQVLVDTSILIDGRFLAVAKTGFIDFDVLIPRSVVGELQTLADGGDDEKRVRARYGLDIISALQSEKKVKVSILADGNSAEEGVDNRLIMLAKKMNSRILTADYNLNKVAKVEGIEVLNINELVQSVRADYLPGEKIILEITTKGNEKKQGVGHLSDGTMVVVENAESLIGSTCEVEFIRSLQTAAGKMMFAKIAGSKIKTEKSKTAGRKPLAKNISKKVLNDDTIKEKNNVDNSKNSKKSTQKMKEPQGKQTKVKIPRRRRTQKTAEDSLVELANRE